MVFATNSAFMLSEMAWASTIPLAIPDEPPKRGKDMNDYLKILLGLQHPRVIERL